MSYKTGIFPGRNPARQQQRDDKFEEFFADLGLTPEGNPFDNDPDMVIQTAKVADLLAKAQGLQSGSTNAIETLRNEVVKFQLGASALPGRHNTTPDIDAFSVTAMTLALFTQELG